MTLTQSLVYLGLALLVARRMGLATRPRTRPFWRPRGPSRVMFPLGPKEPVEGTIPEPFQWDMV